MVYDYHLQQKLLIHKLYQIGKFLLKSQEERNGTKPSNAIDWLRNAFKIADRLEEATAPDVRELKVCFGMAFFLLCAPTGSMFQISLLRTLGLSMKHVPPLVY